MLHLCLELHRDPLKYRILIHGVPSLCKNSLPPINQSPRLTPGGFPLGPDLPCPQHPAWQPAVGGVFVILVFSRERHFPTGIQHKSHSLTGSDFTHHRTSYVTELPRWVVLKTFPPLSSWHHPPTSNNLQDGIRFKSTRNVRKPPLTLLISK